MLDLKEAPEHPHHRVRGGFVNVAGIEQPAPAPRFSRTPGEVRSPPAMPGAGGNEALLGWSFGSDEIERLRKSGALG